MLRCALVVCAFCVAVVFCHAPRTNGQDAAKAISAGGAAGFEELKAQIKGAKTNEAKSKLIGAWVDRVGIEQLSIEQVQWCLDQSLPNATGRKSFSAVWTGTITPPRSGKFIFSVSPINVNQAFGTNPVQHGVAVTVNGEPIVRVGPDLQYKNDRTKSTQSASSDTPANDWQWKGNPIELKGDEAVPIRVEMKYACGEPSKAASPSAILMWEGPGVERQVVPTESLSQADGSSVGLNVEYSLHDGKGPPRTAVQTSRNIDFAWATPADVAPADPDLIARLNGRLWQLATAPEFLDKCAAGVHVHPYFENRRTTQCLTSAQRREFIRLLTDNEQFIGRIEEDQLLGLYRVLRFGAEDDAIDLLGTWMQLHADVAPKITADFFRENRQVYAELAIHLARQQQGAYQVLQDRYLEMPDGRCALPVAFTLTYCHLHGATNATNLPSDSTGPSVTSSWQDFLDAKIEERDTDARHVVSWLLARAQSVEPRAVASSIAYQEKLENLRGGIGFLTEAHLIAPDNGTRAGVFQEELARAIATNREAECRRLLKSASGIVPQQRLLEWQNAVNEVADNRRRQHKEDQAVSQAAYVREIQARRDLAAARNDAESLGRYDAMLEASK